MTSGNFAAVPVGKIVVDRENRQRRELTNIEELAESISKSGLINPITITRDFVLVAGERRLTAVRSLGWDSINVQFAEDLSERELAIIELEENVKRVDLSWLDHTTAIAKYHETRKAEPEWSVEKTAEALGYSSVQVYNHLKVASEIDKGNTAVAAATKFSVAKGITERVQARRMDSAATKLRTQIGASVELVEKPVSPIQNANFLEWVEEYSGPKFNFIHCDFPYGINADKIKQGTSQLIDGSYADTADVYWNLLDKFTENIERLCSDQCHLMFWLSAKYEIYSETMEYFLDHTDFKINPMPLIWHKTDNIGLLPDPQRGPRQVYEMALFGSRGDRKIVRAKSNAHGAPTASGIHQSEKPEPMLRHFFEMIVDNTTIMLDPTCGSGAAIRAAESLGAAHCVGLELNPEYAERAQKALEMARKLRAAK